MLRNERAQEWASECPDVKNYKWRFNPVWHRKLYSSTHMATVDIKGLNTSAHYNRDITADERMIFKLLFSTAGLLVCILPVSVVAPGNSSDEVDVTRIDLQRVIHVRPLHSQHLIACSHTAFITVMQSSIRVNGRKCCLRTELGENYQTLSTHDNRSFHATNTVIGSFSTATFWDIGLQAY